jgi:hypothetical protein
VIIVVITETIMESPLLEVAAIVGGHFDFDARIGGIEV